MCVFVFSYIIVTVQTILDRVESLRGSLPPKVASVDKLNAVGLFNRSLFEIVIHFLKIEGKPREKHRKNAEIQGISDFG